jgi:plastocyanin
VIALVAVGSWAVVEHRMGIGEPVATDRVDLLLNDFDPDAIVIPVGSTVTWRFDGAETHDIVGEGWGTEARSDGTYRRTFDEVGTFDYRCTLHGPMRGRVLVE